MINPDENEWSRFHRIREDLSELPAVDVRTRIARLKADGEGTTIISMLELHFKLARPPGLQAGRCLANRYTIKQKIGEGGMGVVYQAVQELTQQAVALKVIHPALVSSRLIKRFREEIRTLGKLQHDHIVRVFDADHDKDNSQAHDILFYAMQLVDGLPLIRWVNERRPSTEARLECFVRICEAVDYAHLHGVVHRDLKPDNILVDEHGRPAILDFGLSQIADVAFEPPQNQLLPEGETVLQVSGTPAFMSRERWEGQPGGPPADVFALGVLLHEMMTGSRPWKVARDAPINDLRKAICNFSPAQLKSRRLGRRLAALLGSMLAPDPAARPVSAATVANTIRSLLTRRRIIRRIRRTAPIWGSLVVAVSSALFTQSYYQHREKLMNESRLWLRQAEDILRERGRIDMLDRVTGLLPSDPDHRHSQEDWRDAVIGAMSHWNLGWQGSITLPRGFNLQAVNRDGSLSFGRGTNGAVELIQTAGAGWATKASFGVTEVVRARFHPLRSEVVVLERNGSLVVWRWDSGRTTILLRGLGPETQFEFSPDGLHLACTVSKIEPTTLDIEPVVEAQVFRTEDWQIKHVFAGRGELVEPGSFIHVWTREMDGLAFSPDGRFLAAWSDGSQNVPVWSLDDKRLVLYAGQSGVVASAAWRPGGGEAELAVIKRGGEIRSWLVKSGFDRVYSAKPNGAFSLAATGSEFFGQLAWAPSGEELFAIDEGNQEVALFLAPVGSEPTDPYLFAKSTNAFRWISDGRLKETAAGSVWERPALEPPIRQTSMVGGFAQASLSFSPDSRILVASDNLGIVFLAATTLNELGRIEMPLSPPAVFGNRNGDLWAYGKNNGPVKWTFSESGDQVSLTRFGRSNGGGVGSLAVAGEHIAISRGSGVFVRSALESLALQTESADFEIAGDRERPGFLALAPNRETVAAIWLNPVRAELWQHRKSVWQLDRSLTNTTLVNGLYDWNGTNLLSVAPRQQRTAEEKAVSFGPPHWPEGTLLTGATASPVVASSVDQGRGIHLDFLGREHCQHIGVFPIGDDFGRSAKALAISPDGALVAATHRDGLIRLWNVRPALARLKDLQLDVPEFALENSGENPPPTAIREVFQK